MARRRKPITQNGHDLFVVISAIQKLIRRGKEEDCLYWAFELIPQYEAYFWRRLCVIVNEDIGLANPQLLILIPTLRDQYFEFRERGKNGTCRLILANAVMAMCRSPKARTADHFQRVVAQRFSDGDAPQIPDYALDKHTSPGKRMGRGFEHWLDVGCKLDNPGDVPDPYREEAEALWKSGRNDSPDWGTRRRSSRKSSGPPRMFQASLLDD